VSIRVSMKKSVISLVSVFIHVHQVSYGFVFRYFHCACSFSVEETRSSCMANTTSYSSITTTQLSLKSEHFGNH